MRATTILLWASTSSAPFAAAAASCAAIDDTTPIVRSSAKPLSCGYRGTFSSPAPAVQAACSTDLDGCKRQCLTKTICKSFAFNTRKQTCTLYGKTLAAQDWSFTGTGAVRQYARQCFEYEVSRPGPNVVRNPSFEDDENYNPVNWNIQTISDEAPSTEGDFCSNIADDSSAYHGDNGLTSIFCGNVGSTDQAGNSREGTVVYSVSQELGASEPLEVGKTYELSFYTKYTVPVENDFPALSPQDVPFVTGYLGDQIVSPRKQGCDISVEGQCEENNDLWIKQGPFTVQPVSASDVLKFEIEMQRYQTQIGLDAGDFHATAA